MLGGYTDKLPKPATKQRWPAYTGKQLFSLFLPKDFNYVITSKWSKVQRCTKDVVIKNGELISGVIDKSSIGAEEPESAYTELQKIMVMLWKRVSKLYLDYGKTIHYSLWFQLWLW